MKTIVFDLETKKLASEVGGFGNAARMGISAIGAWRSDTAMYKIWTEDNIHGFIDWVNWCDMIVGYNQIEFDYKVLSPYVTSTEVFLQKQNIDLIRVIKKATKRFRSLDEICSATLGFGKTSGVSGKDAPILYREGRFEELYNYLLDDIQVTVKLFFHISRFKEVVFKGETYKIDDLEILVKEQDRQLTLNL